jgi:hypothetical protein
MTYISMTHFTSKNRSEPVRFSPPNIWVGPRPVAVAVAPFGSQKTGLDRTFKHYYPEWFSKLLEEKLELVNKQIHGKRVFYSQVQNFWLPQKAAWFNMLQAKTLGPEAVYNPRWFYWDPLELVKIKCPNFKSCQSFLIRNTICKCPRCCVDLNSCFWMIGAQYKCSKCHNEKSGKKTVYFMSWDVRIINSLPKALAAEFPITLTHRSAMYTPLLSLQRSLFHKGLGAQQFAKIIHVQHLRHFDLLQIQYLEMISV